MTVRTLEIPGVETVHSREQWTDPRYPISGNGYIAPSYRRDLVKYPMLHYTASGNLPDGDPGENADDLGRYLRNMQSSATAGRSTPSAGGGRGEASTIGWRLTTATSDSGTTTR